MTSNNLIGKAHADNNYRLDAIFLGLEAYHEELNVHEVLLLLTRRSSQKSVEKIGAAKGTAVCAFQSEQDSEVECRVTDDSILLRGGNKYRKSHDQTREVDLQKKNQKTKSPRTSTPPQYVWGCFEGVFLPDLTRSVIRGHFRTRSDHADQGMRVRRLGLVWTSGPTRSDRDQHRRCSRTPHRNLTRPVNFSRSLNLSNLPGLILFFPRPRKCRLDCFPRHISTSAAPWSICSLVK